MAETRERRRRRAKRPFAYLAILIACAGVALGSAWEATRPMGAVRVIWRGQSRLIPTNLAIGKAQDAATTAP